MIKSKYDTLNWANPEMSSSVCLKWTENVPYLRPLKTNEQASFSTSLADECTLYFEALCSKMGSFMF